MLSANEFLSGVVEGALATKFELVPVGEFRGIIMVDGLDVKPFVYKKGERIGQTGHRLTVKWELEDPTGELKEQLGRVPTITQSLTLDFTENGALDMGKGRNVHLGRLRDALGQNTDGKPWSPQMMLGQMAKLKVEARTDEKGEEQREVTQVASIR